MSKPITRTYKVTVLRNVYETNRDGQEVLTATLLAKEFNVNATSEAAATRIANVRTILDAATNTQIVGTVGADGLTDEQIETVDSAFSVSVKAVA